MEKDKKSLAGAIVTGAYTATIPGLKSVLVGAHANYSAPIAGRLKLLLISIVCCLVSLSSDMGRNMTKIITSQNTSHKTFVVCIFTLASILSSANEEWIEKI